MESDRHRLERMEGVVSRFEGEISGLKARVLALETPRVLALGGINAALAGMNRDVESESSEKSPNVVVKRSRKKDA